MSILIIQLPARQRVGLTAHDAGAGASGAQSYAYVLSVDGEIVSRQGRCELHQMPPADSVVAVMAPTDLSWHSVVLPKAPASRLRAALASMLEEMVLDDADHLHFAVAPEAKAGQPTWIAVCDHTWLTSQLMALEKAKLRVDRVVPGAAPDEPAMALFHEAYEAGQPGAESGPEVLVTWACATGVSTFPLLGSLSRGLLPDPLPGSTRFLATPPVAAPAERWLGHAVSVLTVQDLMLQASHSLWNVLQFELKPRSKGAHVLADRWRRFMSPDWRPVRVGLVALAAVQLVGLNAWAWYQQNNLKARQAEREQIVRQTYPHVKVVRDAPLQMARETEVLRAQAGEAGVNDLEALMAVIASAWPAEQAVKTLRYDGQSLTVSAPAGWGAQELEQFRVQLEAAGARVQAESDGRLTVRRDTMS